VFVALVTQHAKRMLRIILLPVACPALKYFSTLYHNRHDFREKVIRHKLCVLIFATTFVWNIYHSKNNSARHYYYYYYYYYVCMFSCKLPATLLRFKETWIFSTDI